ncbi:MAG: hypothetical protein V1776_02425 [Candidatus Diapherotrites archaeon]
MNAVGNIGPEKRKRKKWVGYILLVTGGVMSGFFIAVHAEWWIRLIVFPLYLGGFLELLQAKTGVCMRHAYMKTTGEE